MNEPRDNPESEPGGQSPDAGVVCTVCVTPNWPRTDYCTQCGAPLNSLVTFNAFDQTLVEGFAYRRAVDGPPSKIILVGMWLWFGPSILFVPFLFSDLQFAVFAAPFPFSLVILYRTTANYISKRKNFDLGNSGE